MRAKVATLAAIVGLGLFAPLVYAITGGQVDKANNYPNVGCLVYLPPGASGPTVVCSGTLIHPRVFLTAGHSAIQGQQHPELNQFGHVSFATNAFDPSTWHDVEMTIAHPNYTSNGNAPDLNDVGVVILKKPIRDLPLAKLPYAGFLDDLKTNHLLREPGQGGTPLTVVGYGATLDWPPPVLTRGDGWRRFAFTAYQALTQTWLHTNMTPATGNGGTEVGDSGGPTFWVDADGSLTLVALTSHGPLVANNIAWRVDLPETLNFINQMCDLADAGE
jgi:hypothetical protein